MSCELKNWKGWSFVRHWGWVGPIDCEYFSKLITLSWLNLALGPWLNSWGSWFSSRMKSFPQIYSMNAQVVLVDGLVGKFFSNFCLID